MLSLNKWKYQAGAALLAAAFAAPSAYAADPSLSIVATPSTGVVGSTIDLDIRIADVTDLYSYNFSLLFNPAYLQVTGASEGGFLGTGGGATDFGVVDLNGTPGLVSYVYGAKFGAVPGESGGGSLAHLSFKVIGAGTSTLNFSDVGFFNFAGNDIAPQYGALTLVTTAVPEPETYLMMGVGLIGLAALRRRRAG
ncbi:MULTISPECIES: cohesin domain-containing protein [unclassified Duganella]|uniref:cohesin domain-containing protein n=1 Tax=unclassified Duganella TaxID=2636909 RepID=UPI000874640A|nr:MULTISPECIES: cohesin domain-containing protein [unclassified Duganella]OEZ63360.1 cohesin domain protein [Duganella sp. HH105]OFA02904.1 cohesin domain protein [Duganella sp. HH101]OFA02971.1 cohesin domain protein [Duganella sp. HH101]